MIKFPNRRRISELDRIQAFNRLVLKALVTLVIAFALWLQLEFGILEVLWKSVF